MKRIICVLAITGLFTFIGCAKQAPEDAARQIVEKQIATKHQGFILDPSDLDYKVVEEGDDFARVVVSGEIKVKGEIALVRKGDKWVIAPKPGAVQKKSEPAKTGKAPAAPTRTAEKPEAAKGH